MRMSKDKFDSSYNDYLIEKHAGGNIAYFDSNFFFCLDCETYQHVYSVAVYGNVNALCYKCLSEDILRISQEDCDPEVVDDFYRIDSNI